MKLTGKHLKRIQLAIMDGYSQESLRRMVRIQMDVNLQHVAGGANFADVVWNLIEWAEAQNRLQELIDGAYAENPNNAELKALHAEAQGWFAPPPKPEASKSEPIRVESASTPTKPHHAFLSYAHQDADVMRELRRQLGAAGITTWLDEDNLEPGTPEWQSAIEEGIKQAKCLIVLLSPDAKKVEVGKYRNHRGVTPAEAHLPGPGARG
ncbi:MAG: toll/interleukin-1 receptor domain-containing protein [Anaerolineales bacterium]|nr:toll/interleukin-1 receptor domain-containing protein [Anaerolineales bacterium]